jgi:hypothetical protein
MSRSLRRRSRSSEELGVKSDPSIVLFPAVILDAKTGAQLVALCHHLGTFGQL